LESIPGLLTSLIIRAPAGRDDNPILTRFLAPIDCSKIPAQEISFRCRGGGGFCVSGRPFWVGGSFSWSKSLWIQWGIQRFGKAFRRFEGMQCRGAFTEPGCIQGFWGAFGSTVTFRRSQNTRTLWGFQEFRVSGNTFRGREGCSGS
jgi:hypothetical protein